MKIQFLKRIFRLVTTIVDKFRGLEAPEPLVKNMEQAIAPVEPLSRSKDMSDQDNNITGSNEDYIDALIDTFMQFEAFQETMNQPQYVISGSGYAWYYNPNTRAMSRVPCGSEVMLFKKKADAKGRLYCHVGQELLAIPREDLIKIGYN